MRGRLRLLYFGKFLRRQKMSRCHRPPSFSEGCATVPGSCRPLQVRSEGLEKRPVHCEILKGLSDSVPAPPPAAQAWLGLPPHPEYVCMSAKMLSNCIEGAVVDSFLSSYHK